MVPHLTPRYATVHCISDAGMAAGSQRKVCYEHVNSLAFPRQRLALRSFQLCRVQEHFFDCEGVQERVCSQGRSQHPQT